MNIYNGIKYIKIDSLEVFNEKNHNIANEDKSTNSGDNENGKKTNETKVERMWEIFE